MLRSADSWALGPFAVVADRGKLQGLATLNADAEAVGLGAGQPLRDARAICPELSLQRKTPVAPHEPRYGQGQKAFHIRTPGQSLM